MNRHVLAAVALLTHAVPAFAGPPDRLSILMGSYHADATLEFEQTNPGIFLDWDNPSGTTLTVGVYRNSYGRRSLALSASRTILRRGELSLEGFVGLAHYPGDGHKVPVAVGDVVPIAGLKVRYRKAFALMIPGDGATTDAIFAYGLSFDLGRQ
ncbi:hypothetical protein EF888_04075 [Silicimonas algicola]|uniref:Uncharacterized protein n=1 Tax=Silicimonas algicola TaxID=1826607 RepID=A0A316GDR5_9RHOB|nr:hypothetical protein [Silicimonas algicola]AZQ66380.1 hypothetical protein EF888_04075 [Silicimonas algicola]PWK58713.1 hypothetical protein C8D95_101528 [Silicimonas algicola]